MSRAFGDACGHKKTPNVAVVDQPLIALPDVTHADVKANSDDFAVLCCDGVCDVFKNEDLIKYVQEQLQASGPRDADVAAVAANVCKESINRGSFDNVSCVFQDGTKAFGPAVEVLPGYRDNYWVYQHLGKAEKLTLGAAIEKRQGDSRGNTSLCVFMFFIFTKRKLTFLPRDQ